MRSAIILIRVRRDDEPDDDPADNMMRKDGNRARGLPTVDKFLVQLARFSVAAEEFFPHGPALPSPFLPCLTMKKCQNKALGNGNLPWTTG